MARRPRLEVEGGLYHLITRGVERRDIFHDEGDYQKFLALLAVQKGKLPFYLYAYCLMNNHIPGWTLPASADAMTRPLAGQRTTSPSAM